MKNLVLMFCAFAMITVASCTKDDPNDTSNKPSCERHNWGTLAIDNFKTDPYKVYINGGYKGTVNALGYAEYTSISAGTYTVKCEQASGYTFYPTVYSSSTTIAQCYKTTLKVQ